MIKYNYNINQGTEEWHKLRQGILTASEIKKIITPTLKVANNGEVRTHAYEITAQRACNFIEPVYENWDMQRGKIEEEYAKELYSEHYGSVSDCGFITNDKWDFTLGYSPDGLVGTDGLIEIKSRCQKYQTQTIIDNEMPKDFMIQVQSALLISQREWCDFISYSNGMPMFVKRVLPNFEIQAAIVKAAQEFEQRVQDLLRVYTENSKNFIQTERREFETGDEIIPSEPADFLDAA